MEYIIAISVLGLGYVLQYDKKDKKETYKFTNKASSNSKPNGKNIYDSTRSFDIRQNEQSTANVLMNKSFKPEDTNVITPGPPYKQIYNKVDFSENRLPIEYNTYTKYDNTMLDLDYKEPKKENKVISSKERPEYGGFSGVSLTGDAIDPNKFTHNNMIPFFGGSVKQNLDEFATKGIFENFTGTRDTYKNKQETGLFFEPQKNMTNVYGKGNLDGYMEERYYVSNIRSNETPIEKVYVGPGLNKGYTATPDGGFQQADTLDYIMPKTVDEMRVKTKPKMSYYGRVVSGQKIAKPTKIGTVFKNRPDTFFIQDADRYFTTTGQVIGPEQRPCQVLKYTNRKTTELKTRTGSAAPTRGTKIAVRPKFKKSDKIEYKGDVTRNVDASGHWKVPDNNQQMDMTDYGKGTMKLKKTVRMCTGKKTVITNVKPVGGKTMTRNNNKAKITKKENIIGNNRIIGNVNNNAIYKGKAYNPEDIARATIKEQNIDHDYVNNMTPLVYKGVAYDPNDIARTTTKEQNIDHDHVSNMTPLVYKSVAYDPNDTARTTTKEQNIDHDHVSNMTPLVYKSVAYDPKDVARTTTKETNIDNKHIGNYGGAKKKTSMRVPNNKAKPTLKETTIDTKSVSHPNTNINSAHILKKYKLPDNNRMETSVYYTGDATGNEMGAYDVIDVEAPNTMRQFTTTDYTGNAGNSGANFEPMSYQDVYNATIKAVRATIDEGYTPGAQAPNKGLEPTDVNMTTNKLNDIQNNYINERGVQSTVVYNSIPQVDRTQITQNKEIVPNEPLSIRNVDPSMIKAFQENPYTQSLTSWA